MLSGDLIGSIDEGCPGSGDETLELPIQSTNFKILKKICSKSLFGLYSLHFLIDYLEDVGSSKYCRFFLLKIKC